jgi:hypothetical protein
MLSMAVIPKHKSADLLQIDKRNTNVEIRAEPTGIAGSC